MTVNRFALHQGPRLKITQYQPDDTFFLREAFSTADIRNNVRGIPIDMSDESIKRWIRQREFRGRSGFFCGLMLGEVLIGGVGIGGFENSIGYFVTDKYRGNGYALEAISMLIYFAQTELSVISLKAYVHADNSKSERVLQKSGFVRSSTAVGDDLRTYHTYSYVSSR